MGRHEEMIEELKKYDSNTLQRAGDNACKEKGIPIDCKPERSYRIDRDGNVTDTWVPSGR